MLQLHDKRLIKRNENHEILRYHIMQHYFKRFAIKLLVFASKKDVLQIA